MQKRIECKIYGLVQGVSFRYFAKEEADNLNLSGETKNLPDGTLKVVAEGEEGKLKEFIEKLKQGPSYADVASIEVGWKERTGEFSGFSIVY